MKIFKYKDFPEFQTGLLGRGVAKNTITTYVRTMRVFFQHYDEVNEINVYEFKQYCIDNYKTSTVNNMIAGLRQYIVFLGLEDKIKIKNIKQVRKNFLDNVISNEQYNSLKDNILKDGFYLYYFVIRYMATTGARVSEILSITIEDVRRGFVDIYGKGNKQRRLYIPSNLQKETLEWVNNINMPDGLIFRGRNGIYDPKHKLSRQSVYMMLQKFALKYGIPRDVVYPHSFRHLFAKNFLAKCPDLFLLKDLLGHDKIETTMIYLQKTSKEQKQIVDEVVTW